MTEQAAAGAPNAAILFGCLLAGRGLPVDWRAVAEAAALLELPADPPKEPARGHPPGG